MGAPEGCIQHGCIWARPQKRLGWHWEGHFYILFGINGVRNKRSHLVGTPFPEFKARFSATAGWHFSRDLTRCLLIGGVVTVTYLLSMAEITSGSSFEPNNPTEQTETGVRLRVVECENNLEKKTRTLKC